VRAEPGARSRARLDDNLELSWHALLPDDCHWNT
jgi:hypothetical protein